jgi:hypothetical protein
MRTSLLLCAALLATPVFAQQSAEPAQFDDCGWLVLRGGALVDQPDTKLKPRSPEPLPAPPADAKAAYCAREMFTMGDGDERLIMMRLPLVVRARGTEGILELIPDVPFNYHKAGDRYLPGRGDTSGQETIRAAEPIAGGQ